MAQNTIKTGKKELAAQGGTVVFGKNVNLSLCRLDQISRSKDRIIFDKSFGPNLHKMPRQNPAEKLKFRQTVDPFLSRCKNLIHLLKAVKFHFKKPENSISQDIVMIRDMINKNLNSQDLESNSEYSNKSLPSDYFAIITQIAEFSLNCPKIRFYLDLADCVAALTCEAFSQSTRAFSEENDQKEQDVLKSCQVLENLLEDSRLANRDSQNIESLIGSTPLVHGPTRTAIDAVESSLQRELNVDLNHSLQFCSTRFKQTEIAIKALKANLELTLLVSLNRIKLHLRGNKRQGIVEGLIKDIEKSIRLGNGGSSEGITGEKTDNENSKEFNELIFTTENLRKVLEAEMFLAAKQIYHSKKVKLAKVSEIQRQKEEIQRRREIEKSPKENERYSQKNTEKLRKKREITLQKKSDLGLGKSTARVYAKLISDPVFKSVVESSERELVLQALRDGKIWDAIELQRGFISTLICDRKLFKKIATAKGTRDSTPLNMAVREKAFGKILRVFRRYGAVAIDTPVFEKSEILKGKYGEDSKLIYELKEQGGAPLSLRYDLTVPFARYMAMHGVKEIKRYHIGKVYRRDQPAVTKGKFREFHQCDFDIAGHYDSMVPEAEILSLCAEILTDLELGQFIIKVNHRVLLDAIMAVSGVSEQKFRPICSAIDKLDKIPWDEVRDEMVYEKGISLEASEKIKKLIFITGSFREMVSELSQRLEKIPRAKKVLEEMKKLFSFLESYRCVDRVRFDLTLARGLDYYTGLIFEAVLTEGKSASSISGGGRYDNLIGMFSRKNIPAIGVSIGIERILAILEGQKTGVKGANSANEIRENKTDVFVASSVSDAELSTILKIDFCTSLREVGINAEFSFNARDSAQTQINKAISKGCPFMVFVNEDYPTSNMVQFKNLSTEEKEILSLPEVVQKVKNHKKPH